ncbi:MAG TPA: hypothetical protein VFV99_32510 [Kofleriaceae bacterium]|nr:hypothetical protein [Kofleriaceae bacterium]
MRLPLLLLVVVACSGAPPVPHVRYANAPAIEVVNDRRDVRKKPVEVPYERYLENFDGSFHRLMTRKLELKRPERARGVNALDEVPDSTWFTNRIGVREVSVAEIATVPGSIGTPENYKPWTIISSKVGGLTVGFIMKDTRGEKFLLKFDQRSFPEAETAAQIVMGRLLWAIGYNVTDDYIVHLRREDLVLAPDAVDKNPEGVEVKLDDHRLQARLATININKDGSMRALASRYLEGKPLGGHPPEGVRSDDPNDRIPHELRRDLRGTQAIFAWLDHSDVHTGNTLDMWVSDPENPSWHYVKHYFIDFGIALGFGAAKNKNPRYGYEYEVDWSAMARSLFSLGLVQRPWEDRKRPQLRGIGTYDIARYDPGTWKPLTPMYTPIRVADRIDNFWSSKIFMKIRRQHIEAAVDAAQLSDPRARAWLVEALIARQRKTAKYWFERVNPVDEIHVVDGGLCFKDLSLTYAFEPIATTRYTVTSYNRRGKRVVATASFAARGDVSCAPLALADDVDSYTIVRVVTRRPNFKRATFVYVARALPTAPPRVIGIWRQ